MRCCCCCCCCKCCCCCYCCCCCCCSSQEPKFKVWLKSLDFILMTRTTLHEEKNVLVFAPVGLAEFTWAYTWQQILTIFLIPLTISTMGNGDKARSLIWAGMFECCLVCTILHNNCLVQYLVSCILHTWDLSPLVSYTNYTEYFTQHITLHQDIDGIGHTDSISWGKECFIRNKIWRNEM